VNFRSFAFKVGEGAVGLLIILIVRLHFQLPDEVVGVVRTERRAKQRMRGVGEVAGAAARDGAADVVEETGRVLGEEGDPPARALRPLLACRTSCPSLVSAEVSTSQVMSS
jgi:hypothetical protein